MNSKNSCKQQEVKDIENCLTCQFNKGITTPGGIVFQTKHWLCDHSFDTPLPGFLILKTRRHVESFAYLTQEEACEFGIVLFKLTKALKQVLHPEKIYILKFGEVVKHLHFWLIPRTTEVLKNCGKGPESVMKIIEFYRSNFSIKDKKAEIINIIKQLQMLL